MLRQDRQVVHRGVAGLMPEQLAFRGETSPATSRRHLASRGVSPDPEMQIDPIGLELDESTSLLAVVFAPGLHGQHPDVSREPLQRGKQVSYGHPPGVANRAVWSVLSPAERPPRARFSETASRE
jgi:hypothetical protein